MFNDFSILGEKIMMNMQEIEKKWQERWEKDKAAYFNKRNIGIGRKCTSVINNCFRGSANL